MPCNFIFSGISECIYWIYFAIVTAVYPFYSSLVPPENDILQFEHIFPRLGHLFLFLSCFLPQYLHLIMNLDLLIFLLFPYLWIRNV